PRRRRSRSPSSPDRSRAGRAARGRALRSSEDVAAEVLVLDDALELLPHQGRVHDEVPELGAEGRVLQDGLEDRVQAPRPDVLDLAVHALGVLGDRVDAGLLEAHPRAVDGEQRLVLLREGVLRLGEDAPQVALRELLELDADREPPLQLGDQVARLRHAEGAGRDEQHVVGAYGALPRGHLRALDDRQQVALYALAADVAAADLVAAGDLVDLVDEDDARLLGAPDRLAADGLAVDERPGLLVLEDAPGLPHRDAALDAALGHEPAEHVLQVHAGLLHAGQGDRHVRLVPDLDLDDALVELSALQQAAHALPALG